MSGQGWLGLEGKVCVVTGAAGGIGSAIALAFAAQGTRLALLDREREGLRAIAERVRTAGAEAATFEVDLTRAERVADTASEVAAQFGPAEILVNNAGLLRAGELSAVSLADWQATLDVNLTGYFLCAQNFGRQMRSRGGGSMVHIASIAGHGPQPASGSYSPSKAAVVMLSRQIAAEWGPSGIRSNTVSPGMIRTPMSRAFYEVPGIEEARRAMIASRRIGEPQDIADVVLFLASDRAGYVNGTDVLTDGGFGCTAMGLIPRPGF